jgi:hypothetical protein
MSRKNCFTCSRFLVSPKSEEEIIGMNLFNILNGVTGICREVVRYFGVLDLFLQDIGLVQEKDDRRVAKPPLTANCPKQREALYHAVLQETSSALNNCS